MSTPISIEPGPPGLGFDLHHAPDRDLLADCVHCGFCLPACPTYKLWGDEMDSPRGRIYLMKMISDGEAPITATAMKHLDQCLGCMGCMPACPSGVQYDKLIEATRSQIERNGPRPFWDRAFRRALFETFPYHGRLRALTVPLLIYQRSFLRGLAHSLGLVKQLPERLQALESLMPAMTQEALTARLPRFIPAEGKSRRRVGLVEGCVQRAFFGDVNVATARVLAAEGCDVVVPENQGCCGALEVHAGQEERALARARQLIAEFERADVETVVINAAGCGSTLKEYGHLLRDDPKWAARAKAFSAKVLDISEILADLEPQGSYAPIPYRVAYHDACHLQHAQGVRLQPRAVLHRIPQLDVLEIAESDMCCGSAGVYNLIQVEPARALGDRKVQNLLATDAQAVASSNPGCLLQMLSALERAGKPMPTLHPVELLDASLRNEIPAKLRRLR